MWSMRSLRMVAVRPNETLKTMDELRKPLASYSASTYDSAGMVMHPSEGR
jgi:hypothetical protein